MSEVENLLHQLLDKMSDIGSTLEEISGKLDNVDGIYGLDDIVSKLDEVTDRIVGPTGYDLTDLHGELVNITSEISSVNTTLMLKD
jgi:hypothetical protein